MVLPNFLVIGTPKAATTSIYYYLKQHPQIYIPQKEPEFFALEGEKLEYPGPREKFKIRKVTHIKDYESLFDGVTDEIAIGDVSPIYMYYKKAPVKIKFYIPDAKLIAILRDPVERAFSHYVFWASQGFEPDTDFDFNLAVREEAQRINDGWHPNWHYIQIGFYYEQIKRYLNFFKPYQLKILLYEDLIKDKHKFCQDIFEFLEVDTQFIPSFTKTHNSTEAPKNRTINCLFNRPNPFKTIFKPLTPKSFRNYINSKVKQKNLGKPKLSRQFRKELIAVYREDILKVQDLIQRDLSQWLE